jgi:hypothetical protein
MTKHARFPMPGFRGRSTTAWRRGGAALAAALAGACAGGQSTTGAAEEARSVRALIGDAACNDDAQCRTVGVGAKACGGPEGYLAWSALRTDATALQAAAQRQADLERAAAKEKGMASNCSVVVDPGAYCAAAPASGAGAPSARTCRLRSGARPIS